VGKKAFDPLFSYREGEEGDYLNLKDPEYQLYNIKSSSKGDIPLQGDEDEDMEILETSEGEEFIVKPVAEAASAKIALATTATGEAACNTHCLIFY